MCSRARALMCKTETEAIKEWKKGRRSSKGNTAEVEEKFSYSSLNDRCSRNEAGVHWCKGPTSLDLDYIIQMNKHRNCLK